MKKPQLYLETSVWNFYFADDAPEKREITLRFFDKVKQDEYEIIGYPLHSSYLSLTYGIYNISGHFFNRSLT